MNLLIFHQLPAINVIFAVIGDGISGYFPFLFGLDFIDNQFKDWAIGFFDQAYSNDVIETCIKNIDMKSEAFNSYWSVVSKLTVSLKPIGYALASTYFLMHVFDEASKDNLTIDGLLKVTIQLVLTIAVINNIEKIINALLTIGNVVCTKMGSATKLTAYKDAGKTIFDAQSADGTSTARIFIRAAVAALLHLITFLAIDFAIISRMLELGWRIILAPVGIANCFDGGANSPGIRYLKSILATALSGAAIIVVAALGVKIAQGIAETPTSFNDILLSQAAMLGTAGAAIGVSGKIKEVV